MPCRYCGESGGGGRRRGVKKKKRAVVRLPLTTLTPFAVMIRRPFFLLSSTASVTSFGPSGASLQRRLQRFRDGRTGLMGEAAHLCGNVHRGATLQKDGAGGRPHPPLHARFSTSLPSVHWTAILTGIPRAIRTFRHGTTARPPLVVGRFLFFAAFRFPTPPIRFLSTTLLLLGDDRLLRYFFFASP